VLVDHLQAPKKTLPNCWLVLYIYMYKSTHPSFYVGIQYLYSFTSWFLQYCCFAKNPASDWFIPWKRYGQLVMRKAFFLDHFPGNLGIYPHRTVSVPQANKLTVKVLGGSSWLSHLQLGKNLQNSAVGKVGWSSKFHISRSMLWLLEVNI
jgi:hypothetical protein